MTAIEALLTMDPQVRPAATEVKKMPVFRNVDWDNQLQAEPPFVPTLDDIYDTGYFQGKPLLLIRFTYIYIYLYIIYIIAFVYWTISKHYRGLSLLIRIVLIRTLSTLEYQYLYGVSKLFTTFVPARNILQHLHVSNFDM